MLILAAILCLAVGLAHSVLGERYILVRLFRLELPKLFGDDWFTRRTLRFAWHLTTFAWWGFGAMLFLVDQPDVASREIVLNSVATVFVASALLTLGMSRGRHLAWLVFLAIAVLALLSR